jgi:hypothetical protein
MALIVNGSIFQIRAYSSFGGQTQINRFYYKCTAPAAVPATDQDAATQFDTLFSTLLIPFMSSQVQYNGAQCQIFAPPNILRSATSTAGAGPGTEGAAILPGQVSQIISWQTQFGRPSFRGRSYIGFPSAAGGTTGGRPTLTHSNGIIALGAALLGVTAVAAGGRTSTVALHLRRQDGAAFEPIINFAVAAFWATTRRRGSYGRPNASPI